MVASPAKVAPKSPTHRPCTAELCHRADKLSKEVATLNESVQMKTAVAQERKPSPPRPHLRGVLEQGEREEPTDAKQWPWGGRKPKSAVTGRVEAMAKQFADEQAAVEQAAAEASARQRAAAAPDPTKITADSFERRYWAKELTSTHTEAAVQRVATASPRISPRTSSKLVSAVVNSVARAAAAKATADKLAAARRVFEKREAMERAAAEEAEAIAKAKERAAAAKAVARREAAEREEAETAAAERAAAERAAAKMAPIQRAPTAAEKARAAELAEAKKAAERVAAQEQAVLRAAALQESLDRAPGENALVQKALKEKQAAEARHDGRWPPGRDPFEVPRDSWVV